MQDFFRCKEGYEAKADVVADMHYEARIHDVIQYHAEFVRERIPKRRQES